MKLIKTEKYSDGSAWSVVFSFGKVVVTATFIAGKLKVESPRSSRTGVPSCSSWCIEKVEKYAKEQISNLDQSWLDLHYNLYKL